MFWENENSYKGVEIMNEKQMYYISMNIWLAAAVVVAVILTKDDTLRAALGFLMVLAAVCCCFLSWLSVEEK